MTLLRVAFQTLGCKLNQLETESVADAFFEAGATIVPFHERADLYVINTCTVTSKAEQKARHDIRAALARSPHAVAIATGCYAQMNPEQLSALDERVVVVSGDLKASLLALASWLSENWQGHGELLHAVQSWQDEMQTALAQMNSAAINLTPAHASPKAIAESGKSVPLVSSALDRFAFHPDRFAMHTRPALKVQDGCDHRCAYCRVCFARGPSVSLDSAEVVARVRKLEAAGKAEVVLTGVNLAQYRDGGLDFAGLLSLLIRETDTIKFRVSSYEPERIDEAFLEAFASFRVRPHIHLSVQSGCTETLRRMARPYGAEKVRRAVRDLRAVRDDPFLACDVIAGFPGETDAEFETTFALLADLRFAWIHAFPFSARPGTRAATMTPRIPERVAGQRVERLLELAARGKREYISRWIGRRVEMVVERADTSSSDGSSSDASSDSKCTGTTENYLKAEVRLPNATHTRSAVPPLPGTTLAVTICRALDHAESDICAEQ